MTCATRGQVECARKGVPTWALQELGRWKSESTVERYAHINADHLAPYVKVVGTLLAHPTKFAIS
nr:MAG: hypothetical protein DIU57_18595 [Pseudomonadota bacterium]